MINYVLYSIIGVVILMLISGIRIVRPTHRMLIETLGKYSKTAEPGFTWIIPIIQSTRYVNITEQMVDVEPQMVITKDKLNAEVDAVVYYRIKDVKGSQYNVDDHEGQLTSLSRTTLRAVIGKMTLADANEKRSEVNLQVEKVLEKETNSYGVTVLRVEIQRIEPPKDVQSSMNNVVKAEQDKIAAKDLATAVETQADGQKRANIKGAQGTREALILKAQGNRQASILEAEGKSKAFDLIEKSFKGNAQTLKRLEVTENSLKNNSKIILTEKGITPQLLIGELPIKK